MIVLCGIRCRQREVETVVIYHGRDDAWYILCHSIALLGLYVDNRTQSFRGLYNKRLATEVVYISFRYLCQPSIIPPRYMKRKRGISLDMSNLCDFHNAFILTKDQNISILL